MRFKIRTMMIVIASVAGLLGIIRVLPLFARLMVLCFVASCVAISYGLWRAARGYNRLPRVAFGASGALINALCVVASLKLSPSPFIVLILLTCLVGPSVIFGYGAAWCTAAARDHSLSRCSRALRWTIVSGVSIAPLATLSTGWPFRMAFALSRPSLERLADRVKAGVPVTKPRWAGVFVIVGSSVDPKTGNVGLITDPDPSGRSGFERYGAAGTRGAFYNLWSEMELDENWRYAEED